MNCKEIAKQIVGEALLGIIDYYRFPESRSSWGGPFNGQQQRQLMVKALLGKLRPAAIIETGTYHGTTTAFVANLVDVPVYTVECSVRYYWFCRLALRKFNNVHLWQGDSRSFIKRLAAQETIREKRVFFYLDAHWGDDLPLSAELEVIFKHWREGIVLIDDFRVPYDVGFGYDDYGAGKALEIDYISLVADRFDLSAFFPSTSSSEETGARRGSVTIVASSELKEVLRNVSELREYPI
jgi:hypothetical protein